MSSEPTWDHGWTERDEHRLEKQAQKLESLAEQYESAIAKNKHGISSIHNSLNTDAGNRLSIAIEEWCSTATGTVQKMRDAAAAIRAYNNKMITLWEAFQAELKNYFEQLTRQQ